MSSPLADVRVLDLTRLMPGYVTTLLGDLGADIIKVEEPLHGDPFRTLGPKVAGTGYAFRMMHRNKRAVGLNLKHAAGAAVFRRLAARSDVVVESFRPGVMQRLGLDYASLVHDNPRLVYCAISGYGQSGPYRDRPGHDINYAALAGVLGLGQNSCAPVELPVPLADFESAQRAVMSILALLFARQRTGRGGFIDIAMADGLPAWLLQPYAEFFATGILPDPNAARCPDDGRWVGMVPGYGIYAARDGYLAIGAAEQKFWLALCGMLRQPDLATLRTGAPDDTDRLQKALRAALASEGVDHWVRECAAHDVPCTPVLDLAGAQADEQLRARRVFLDATIPGGDATRQIATAFGIAELPRTSDHPAPDLGQHTDEVLGEIGYAGAELAALRRDGTI